MASPVRILGVFVDTLYLNVYQTDIRFQPVKKGISEELKLKNQKLKDLAQELEENIPTRSVFDGSPLLTMTKGSEGFNFYCTLKNSSSYSSSCIIFFNDLLCIL
ncbi:hypothetical protein ccbrp13_52980 [Ktedonobacteria bacterium brp13]|nr:hypothetical protein ccbrp13_52980 [Ktedonobacteria bacterium brp13]